MPDVLENRYEVMSPEEAALFVVSSEAAILGMGLPQDFTGAVFGNIKAALDRRIEHGFETKIVREEVCGLVHAVMGDGYDHLRPAELQLRRYVVGLLQTNEEAIAVARQQVSN